MKKLYDCGKCPGYCCSYPRIILEPGDLRRLAKELGMSKSEVRKRYTKIGEPDNEGEEPPRIIRHKKDSVFGTICAFFDLKKRRCGVYPGRPQVCRDYPGRKRCGYYEFLTFERDAQEDPDFIALTGN